MATGGFSFGTQAAKPGFGTAASTPAAGTSFNFGGFGANTSSATPSLSFGTNTTASTGATSFGFGTTAAPTTAPSTGFGFGTATTTSNTGFNFSGFGSGSTSGFGSGLTTTSASTGFGTTGLGGASTLGGIGGGLAGFGTQNQANAQAQQLQNANVNNLANMSTAVSLPVIFGDERDTIIAKWNQLQAFWGTGKGFFNQQGHFVTFTQDNPFCSFKAVGYSCIPSAKNEDGLVALTFGKKVEEITQKQQIVVDTLGKILGSKPNLSVCVETVKGLPDDKTEMIIYVQERAPTGTTKRILASDLCTFLTSAVSKQHLTTQLTVTNVVQKTGFTSEQLRHHLENPSAGINPLIWQQAKRDNPDPEKLIPVPLVGFGEVQTRLKLQEQQTKLHQARLDVITQDIGNLQRSHSNILSKIDEYKRRHLELSHRALQVLVKQEIYRKLGYAIQIDEEQLRVQLEACQAELNAPTQFKGRLNELMSQLRMQNHMGGQRSESGYQMDESVQQEIRQHLKQQQDGLSHLISIIKEDLGDLKLIEHGLSDSVKISR